MMKGASGAPPLLLPLLLLQQACTVSGAKTLEVKVHYPASQIQALNNTAVFTLVLCYQPGCATSDNMWNQSMPGPLYDPRLTIFQSDYTDNDVYTKEIELPAMHSDVFVTIYAGYEIPGNPFSRCAVKVFCDSAGQDPVSNACVHVGMPYRSVQHSSEKALVVAFPYFGMQQGSVYSLLPDLYSPQLQNRRDINVYVPASLLQNPLSRAVNVLIINDGTLYFLEQLAFAGGMDHALLKGSVPETIMIGLPQNATGCQRQFELTFSVTSGNTSCAHVSAGGTDRYLAFIKDTVVPAATAALDVKPGEMSMAGVSYGGLTACYAAAAQPEYFRRVFCQSPSVWWNFGELARVVTANAATTQQRPLAVVVYIGTTEMSVPLCSTVSCASTSSWFTYVNDMVEAFRAAGGASLHFFTLAGGQHDATAWTTTFAAGVTQMFAANFTAPFQMQYAPKSAVNVLYPVSTSGPCGGGVPPAPNKPATKATTALTFFPPALPKEYMYNVVEDYRATSIATGAVLNHQSIAGSQYWSLHKQAQRGIVASGPGMDKGRPTPAINTLSVTSFTDTGCTGSLVNDLIGRECKYYKVEGGSPYDGYDFYRTSVQQAVAGGLPVEQTNVTDWVSNDGVHHGPVNMWAFAPPSAEVGRVLKYTLVFRDGTNILLAYLTSGTESLPDSNGALVPVNMMQSQIRTGYRVFPDDSANTWAPGFFNSTAGCLFPDAVVFPQGSEANECTTANSTKRTPATPVPTAAPAPTPGTVYKLDNGVEVTSLVIIVFIAMGLLAECYVRGYRSRSKEEERHQRGDAASTNPMYHKDDGGNESLLTPDMGNHPSQQQDVSEA